MVFNSIYCLILYLILVYFFPQVLKARGGALPGRRVKHGDMAVKADDHVKIRDCFGIGKFNSEAWLGSLTPEQNSKYLKEIENHRVIQKQVESTVKFIKEFIAVEEPWFYGFSVLPSWFSYLTFVVLCLNL